MSVLASDPDYALCEDLAYIKELHDLFPINQSSDKVAVIYDDGESALVKQTYREIDSLANFLKSKFEKFGDGTSQYVGRFIAVSCPQNCVFPAVLLGILRAKYGFYNLDEYNLPDDIKFAQVILNVKLIVIEDSILQRSSLKVKYMLNNKLLEHTHWYDDSKKESAKLHIFLLQNTFVNERRNYNYLNTGFPFAIGTSGTTGSKKMVLVPNSCIVPNITFFIQSVWKMNRNDVVFGASPPTFDPHIVELFTALGSEATILYVPKRVKLVGELLAPILRKHGITVMQITPSLFRRIQKNLIEENLFRCESSSLEILAFGGEKCLSKSELKDVIGSEMLKRLKLRGLQNLYGITEVSCWASVENIDLESEDDITIGNPIINTKIHFAQDGSISIGSDTRVCTVVDSTGDIVTSDLKKNNCYFIETGDTGFLNENNAIVYISRNDRLVKRNGYKTSLVNIENIAMNTNQLQTAQCVFYKDKVYLIIQFKFQNTQLAETERINCEFIPKLLMDIPPQIYPDVIVSVKQIPINQNGKIDMGRILSITDNQNSMKAKSQERGSQSKFDFRKDMFNEAVKKIWSICTNAYGRNDMSNIFDCQEEEFATVRFIEAGGDSLSAVRFIEEVFTYLKLFGSDVHAKYEKEVFKLLMVESFNKVFNFLCDIGQRYPVSVSVNTLDVADTTEVISETVSSDVKCVNKPPSRLSNDLNQENPLKINVTRKRQLSDLPNNPIVKFSPKIVYSCGYDLRMCVDASATVTGKNNIHGSVCVIGSHSGYATAVLLNRPKISNANINAQETPKQFPVLWEVQLGGRIEASATIHPNHLITYIGTHNKRLYSLNTLTGHINWRFECKESVRAAPVLSLCETYLIFSDEISLYNLNAFSGKLIWEHKGLRPIPSFSLTINNNCIFVTSFGNKIEAIDLLTGRKIWTRKGDSSDVREAYCTGPILVNSKEENRRLILIGTRNGRLEAIKQESGEVVWSCTELQVQLVSVIPDFVPFNPIWYNHYENDCENSFIVFLNHKCNGVIICPETGAVFNSFQVNQSLLSLPGIISMKDTNSYTNESLSPPPQRRQQQSIAKSKSPFSTKCLVFYGLNELPVLTFIEMETPHSRFDIPTNFSTNAENFSTPTIHDNLILVGGRDNKLHVFELESYSK